MLKRFNSFKISSSSEYLSTLIGSFFKTSNLFIRIIKLNLPANSIVKDLTQQPKGSVGLKASDELPNLAINQIIAPLGLDSTEFCAQFNGQTAHIEKHFPVRLFLYTLPDRKFFLEIKAVTTSTLFNNFLGDNDSINIKINLLELYKVILIKTISGQFAPKIISRTVLGSLRSFGKVTILY